MAQQASIVINFAPDIDIPEVLVAYILFEGVDTDGIFKSIILEMSSVLRAVEPSELNVFDGRDGNSAISFANQAQLTLASITDLQHSIIVIDDFSLKITCEYTNATITPADPAEYYTYDIQPYLADLSVTNVTLSQAYAPIQDLLIRHSIELNDYQFPITLKSLLFADKVCEDSSELWCEIPRYTTTDKTLTIIDSVSRQATVILKSVDVWDIPTVTVTGNTWNVLPTIIHAGDVAAVFVHSWYKIVNGSEVFIKTGTTCSFTEDGNYTLRSIDQFGLIKEVGLTVSGYEEQAIFGMPPAFFKIENANSIKYFNQNQSIFDRKLWHDEAYRNIELQCYKQKLTQSSVITTQVKSSYRSILAEILDVNGVVRSSTNAVLKVQYTRLTDKRDATLRASEDFTHTYITFDGGATYEVDTTNITGSYVPNGGQLPNFATVGMFVKVDSIDSTLEVVDIVYLTNLNKWAIKVPYVMPNSTAVASPVQSYYNFEDFDIYEFDSVFSGLVDGEYSIRVTATDTDYPTVIWNSEPISLKNSHKNTVTIGYSNPSNINQIDYSTGIINQLIVPARFIRYKPKLTSDSFNTETNKSILLKTTVTRACQLEVVRVPQYLAEKVAMALSHKLVTIDGINATLLDDLELTDKLDDRNPFYNIIAVLQLDDSLVISEATGVASGSVQVLGTQQNKVIGI